MTIEIEKGVPIPDKAGRKVKYPLDDMDVGDSFFVPDADHQDISPVIAARRRARKWTRQFTTRREDDGIRVWRTA